MLGVQQNSRHATATKTTASACCGMCWSQGLLGAPGNAAETKWYVLGGKLGRVKDVLRSSVFCSAVNTLC